MKSESPESILVPNDESEKSNLETKLESDQSCESEKAKVDTKSGSEMKSELSESKLEIKSESEMESESSKSILIQDCESSKSIQESAPKFEANQEVSQNPVKLSVKQPNPGSAEKKRKNESDVEDSPSKVQKVCNDTN
jgi:hypothetical protein